MCKCFVSPHVHPASLDSGSTIQAMVDREVELGTGAVTATDHGSMAACREVYDAAKKKGLTPILGMEAYVRDDNCPIFAKAGVEKVDGKYDKFLKYQHLTVHSLDQPAFEAMSRILSRTWLTRTEKHGSELKPIFNWADLEELGSHNITFGTGCLIGLIQRLLLVNRPDLAIAYFKRLQGLVKPGNLYVEVFPHSTTHQWVEGTFLHFADGTRLKVWAGKKFRTNAAEEIAAEAISWDPKPHTHVLGTKNRSTWEIYPEPKALTKAENIQGFMANECSPFAPDGDTQRSCNRFMLELAKRFKLPVLVSDDAHFAHQSDKIVQDIRLSDGPRSWKFYTSYHRFSGQEAFDHFKASLGTDEATFEGWVQNSYDFAGRFKDFKLDHPVSLPAKFYPPDTLKHTYELIDKHGRMDWGNPAMKERLEREIELYHHNGKLDLLPYFMTCEEMIDHCQEVGELTGPGRGSAAGTLLNYLLEVTHVNPLEHDLSLERFLTLDRVKSGKMPDVDMDFGNREVLVDPKSGYLAKRFGDHFCQLSVVTTMRLKSSMKDVARARLGFVPKDIEDWCGRLPTPPQGVTDTAFVFGYHADDGTEIKGLIDTSHDLQEYAKRYPEDWEIVKKCLSVPRQNSRHASAFAIAGVPISQRVPMMTVSDVPVTQYTAKSVEASGILKFDILGLSTLNDIGGAAKIIRQRSALTFEPFYQMPHGRVPLVRIVPWDGGLYDLWKLPATGAVFEDICKGRTETVFQLNTHAAKQWLKEFNHPRPGGGKKLIASIDDIGVFTALDRPGPLDAMVGEGDEEHNMLQEYARRARGYAPVDEVEALSRLIPETYGVLVMQEQVQRIYQNLTGCSGSDAEEFRSNLAKKLVEKVEKAYPFFMEHASAKVGPVQAEKIWAQMKTFSAYGFNKSHAISYSYIAYTCAWLKNHKPLEWWCAVLANADKEKVYEQHWPHCGHLVDMPDANHSEPEFAIHGDRIKAPLGFLKGVGEKAQAELAAGRPYRDIQDFADRIRQQKDATKTTDPETGKVRAGRSALNKGVVADLIITGTLDALFEPGLTDLEKLQRYHAALATAMGKKKPEPVDPKWIEMDLLSRYQHRKAIMPIYSDDIRRAACVLGAVQGLRVETEMDPSGDPEDRFYYDHEGETLRVINGAELQILNRLRVGDDAIRVACCAYVLAARTFDYGGKDGKPRRRAVDFTLDLGGHQTNMVLWPPRQGRIPDMPPGHRKADDLIGGIVLLMLNRYRDDRPFGIESLQIVRSPLESKKGTKE